MNFEINMFKAYKLLKFKDRRVYLIILFISELLNIINLLKNIIKLMENILININNKFINKSIIVMDETEHTYSIPEIVSISNYLYINKCYKKLCDVLNSYHCKPFMQERYIKYGLLDFRDKINRHSSFWHVGEDKKRFMYVYKEN